MYLYLCADKENNIKITNNEYNIMSEDELKIKILFPYKNVMKNEYSRESELSIEYLNNDSLTILFRYLRKLSTFMINGHLTVLHITNKQLTQLFMKLTNYIRLILSEQSDNNTQYELYEIAVAIGKISDIYCNRYLSLVDELNNSEISFEALLKRAN